MSYIDWRYLPRREQAPSPSRSSTLQVVVALSAGMLPFLLLGILAAFASNAKPPVTTGLPILGP